MCGIIESSRDAAYRDVNITLIQRNWLIGYRITEEEIKGADRAEYGAGVIAKLAKELTSEYGKGFTKSNLYNFYSFYKAYPKIFQTVSGKSFAPLSWSVADIMENHWCSEAIQTFLRTYFIFALLAVTTIYAKN